MPGPRNLFRAQGLKFSPFWETIQFQELDSTAFFVLFVFTMTEVGHEENVEQSIAAIYQSTTTAPVNIAVTLPPHSKVQINFQVIKYWGKRDTKLNLPTNSSLSVTLSQKDLCALTTASCSSTFTDDHLWLNGVQQPVHTNSRLTACLRSLRHLRSQLESSNPSLPILSKMNLHIVSENNFPTAAGLASSAAGFAALVRAVADLYVLAHSESELSQIARQGSGSACRSMFGGYVAWKMGVKDDGSDSVAEQVATTSHWPQMRAAILVVSAAKKGVSSTAGMQNTVATSTLFVQRAQHVVPDRMSKMKLAIQQRDFATFADLTMKDSNSFHAVCLDTCPPIFYLNDTSRAIIRLVEELNRVAGKTVAAYTFDAGPNAVIYYLEENERWILALLTTCFEGVPGLEGVQAGKTEKEGRQDVLLEDFDVWLVKGVVNGVSRIILTSVGEGPEKVDETRSLIDAKGEPLKGKRA
jgi:diphosphomevalonate decarboxylase